MYCKISIFNFTKHIMNIKSLCFFFNFQNVIKWTRLNQVWPSGCMFDTSTLKKDKVCFNDFLCVCVCPLEERKHTHTSVYESVVCQCVRLTRQPCHAWLTFHTGTQWDRRLYPKVLNHIEETFFFLFLISPHSELLSLSSKLWRPWKWQYQILRHREKSQICVWAQMEKSNSRLMLEKKSLLTIT